MRNGVQVVAYADRFGGSIREAGRWLRSYFGDAVTGVHLLPFFTPFDGADAGFDPTEHTAVDPRLGTWDDVRTLGEDLDVMVDVIVNHVSNESESFRDYQARGEASRWAAMFLTYSSVFPDGATEADLTAIYRPRPGLPFTPYQVAGRPRLIWTTFTGAQIDIDVYSEPGRAYLLSILERLAAANTRMIRLDAVGYAIKKPGASCFMMPETYEFISELTSAAHERGIEVLVEVHSHYQTQIEIASRVDRVYDFALPPLLLHTLNTGDAAALTRWIEMRPTNAITVLDTHDGIGVIDIGPDQQDRTRPGLISDQEVHDLVEAMHENSRGESRLATGAAASNLDLYQVNCTYYAALGFDDALYLAARAVQFFLPGIPQVYYVGLLSGENDLELLQRSGVGRDVNRHHYTQSEVEEQLRRPVNRKLLELMRVRSTSAAFDGEFSWRAEEGLLILEWSGEERATLRLSLATGSAVVSYTRAGEELTLDLA